MISIVPKFTRADIRRMLTEKKNIIEQAIILRLKRIGEQFIKNARLNGSYKDRTGNLRNSVGYVILKDGVQLFESFPSRKAAGSRKAKEAAERSNVRTARGLVLIVVAGMEYAASVESKGYDVLTASSKVAERDLKAAIVKISGKIA